MSLTSNELNEILNKTRRAKEISLTPEQVEGLIKDLDRLEKQDKILEMFKNNNYSVIHKDDDTFILSFNVNVNEIDDFKEWLNNGKD